MTNAPTVRFHDRLQSIPKDDWNRIAGIEYPFLRYEFLAALEESGSVAPAEGWIPRHLALTDANGTLAAIAPCYEKDHSFGEYVFDRAWADAYHRHRIAYYPKLLTAVPFTPSVGPRLKFAPDCAGVESVRQCIDSILAYCAEEEFSSWHLLFPEPKLLDLMEESGCRDQLLYRIGVQYHWYNQGYGSFADYLQAMTSRKRKSIRRERQQVTEQGITFLHVDGAEITPAQLDDFYIFYHATYMKRGQQGYLNRHFFDLLTASMPENLLFVFAQLGDRRVAAAVFFRGGDTLYGRYWGCLDSYHQLHFETCYYQGITYCIEHQIAHFDAGAQGEHKIQRGFEPIATCSAHWIAHPAFRAAIGEFVQQEKGQILAYIDETKRYLPFKQSNSSQHTE